MVKTGKVLVLWCAFAAGVFSSCSARIEGVVKEGGAAEIGVETSLEPATSSLIRSLREFMGESSKGPVLDGAAIGRSMAAAPGIETASFGNTGPSSLKGVFTVSALGDFLADGETEGRFISYSEGPAAGTSSLVIALDRNSAPLLIPRLSVEMEEYLSALMAPAVLGEDIDRTEYLTMLAQVYGRALADEVASARVLVTIEFPRPPRSVTGGTPEGKLARFDIPLVDILVLDRPLRYEVRW